MKDNLKKHIENNRDEFEIYNEDFDAIWEDVNQDLTKVRRINLTGLITKVAAGLLILIVGSFWLYNYSTQNSVSTELAETEGYYVLMIQEKMEMIKSKTGVINPEVMYELSSLDSAYKELKNDLKDNADNEEVVTAMITNYRIKLEILEQILSEIKEQQDEKEVNI